MKRRTRTRLQKSFVTLTGHPASADMADLGIASPSPQLRTLLHALIGTSPEERTAKQKDALCRLLVDEAAAEGWKAVVLPSDPEIRDLVRHALADRGIEMFDAEEYTETVTVNTPKGMPPGTMAVPRLRLRELRKVLES